jgi:hypothetical protein
MHIVYRDSSWRNAWTPNLLMATSTILIRLELILVINILAFTNFFIQFVNLIPRRTVKLIITKLTFTFPINKSFLLRLNLIVIIIWILTTLWITRSCFLSLKELILCFMIHLILFEPFSVFIILIIWLLSSWLV